MPTAGNSGGCSQASVEELADLRLSALRRGVYIGEGARIPGAAAQLDSSVFECPALRGAECCWGAVFAYTSRGSALSRSSARHNRVEIGANVLIADRVFISDHHHEFASLTQSDSRARRLGGETGFHRAGSWLGINVSIMPGVVLAPGCIRRCRRSRDPRSHSPPAASLRAYRQRCCANEPTVGGDRPVVDRRSLLWAAEVSRLGLGFAVLTGLDAFDCARRCSARICR